MEGMTLNEMREHVEYMEERGLEGFVPGNGLAEDRYQATVKRGDREFLVSVLAGEPSIMVFLVENGKSVKLKHLNKTLGNGVTAKGIVKEICDALDAEQLQGLAIGRAAATEKLGRETGSGCSVIRGDQMNADMIYWITRFYLEDIPMERSLRGDSKWEDVEFLPKDFEDYLYRFQQ